MELPVTPSQPSAGPIDFEVFLLIADDGRLTPHPDHLPFRDENQLTGSFEICLHFCFFMGILN